MKCNECGGETTVYTTFSFCGACEKDDKVTPESTASSELTKLRQRHAQANPGQFQTVPIQPTQPTGKVLASTNCNARTWTHDDAVDCCKDIEWFVSTQSVSNTLGDTIKGFHVALTGGTLYKTGTRKDMDIIIYPNDTQGVTLTPGMCVELAERVATLLNAQLIPTPLMYGVGKLVFKLDNNIDIFFFLV